MDRSKQCGYDASFTSEIPEYVYCTTCRLVLRDPIKIHNCGHRFCFPCFVRLKDAATKSKTNFTCPLDREVIDLENVSEDGDVNRIVRNLLVNCSGRDRGCNWQGRLSDLERHDRDCVFRLQEDYLSRSEISNVLSAVNVLEERMNKYEGILKEKTEENKCLKQSLMECKKLWNGRFTEVMKEVLALKQLHATAEIELMESKEKNAALTVQVQQLRDKNEMQAKYCNEQLILFNNQLFTLKKLVNNSMLPSLQAGAQDVVIMRETPKKTHTNTSLLSHKKIDLNRFKCGLGDVTIDDGDNNVEFHDWSTVIAPAYGVPINGKCYYEVTFKGGSGTCRVGWVSGKFLTSEESRLIGNCSHSYGFNGQQLQYKRHNNRQTKWGMKIAADSNEVVGVGIDLMKGEIWYKLDGKPSMEVAFDDIDKDLPYYPAITGCFIKVLVNFGEVEFKYSLTDGWV